MRTSRISQLTPTKERQNVLAFTTPYLTSPPGVLALHNVEASGRRPALRQLEWVISTTSSLTPILNSQVRPIDAPVVTEDRTAALEGAALRDGPKHCCSTCRSRSASPQSDPQRFHVVGQLSGGEGLAVALPNDSPNEQIVDSAIRVSAGERDDRQARQALAGRERRQRAADPDGGLMLVAMGHLNGPVLEFLVLFAVILLGPLVVMRFGLPGLIGLVLGGFAIGAHGLDLIHAGQSDGPRARTARAALPDVRRRPRDRPARAAATTAAPPSGSVCSRSRSPAGSASSSAGRSAGRPPAMCLLGALLASHTLLVYPTLRDAGLDNDPAVATAVGATVLTDTLALTVLAIVSGLADGVGLDERRAGRARGRLRRPARRRAASCCRSSSTIALRSWGSDPVARYLVAIVALLAMAMLAQVFGIEGIVGAFFAGLALNRLVPNEGPSMERVEFFGAAVFVPGVPRLDRAAARSVGDVHRQRARARRVHLCRRARREGARLLDRRDVARLQLAAARRDVRADGTAGGGDARRDVDRLRDRRLRHDGRERGARADPRQHRRLGASRRAGRRLDAARAARAAARLEGARRRNVERPVRRRGPRSRAARASGRRPQRGADHARAGGEGARVGRAEGGREADLPARLRGPSAHENSTPSRTPSTRRPPATSTRSSSSTTRRSTPGRRTCRCSSSTAPGRFA